MPKMKEEKDKFDALEQDWRDAIQGMKAEEIVEKVAQIALEHSALMKAKKEDQDLAEKKEQYSAASEIYRSNTKMSKLRIDYCKSILDAMGK